MSANEPQHPADRPMAVHDLRARHLGIETGGEAIVFMHADCPVARSEGFASVSYTHLTLPTSDLV